VVTVSVVIASYVVRVWHDDSVVDGGVAAGVAGVGCVDVGVVRGVVSRYGGVGCMVAVAWWVVVCCHDDCVDVDVVLCQDVCC